jgi:hypothetical protein
MSYRIEIIRDHDRREITIRAGEGPRDAALTVLGKLLADLQPLEPVAPVIRREAVNG